jgi:farnesyl-diphosphate farnesyltransferase
MKDSLEKFGVDLASEQCAQPWSYSEFMLEKVSRTFALNIQVLPARLKRPVLLAYLFCRMADTLEDEAGIPGATKRVWLDHFRRIFNEPSHWQQRTADFLAELPQDWATSTDHSRFLTAHPQWPLSLFFDGRQTDIVPVSWCVDEMSQGMADYAERQADGQAWVPLKDLADLDQYCYYVAGTVGIMLTDLFAGHSPLISEKRREKMHQYANSFGLGLQLVNIIKDAAEDARRGISFIPEELTQRHGISTRQLLEEEHRAPALRVIRDMSAKALNHLDEAMTYTLLIPRLEPRIRLFCLWPLFMAAATLGEVLKDARVLGPDKVKISRAQVKRIMMQTSASCASNTLLRMQYARLRQMVVEGLERLS